MAQFVVADVSIILKPSAPSFLQIVSSLPSTMSFNLDIVLGYIHSHPIFETLALLRSSRPLLVGTWTNSVSICPDTFLRFKTIMMPGFVHRRSYSGMRIPKFMVERC
jgi:hypothetical protein